MECPCACGIGLCIKGENISCLIFYLCFSKTLFIVIGSLVKYLQGLSTSYLLLIACWLGQKSVSSLKIISKQSEDHVNLHLKVKCSKCLLRKIFSMSRNGSAHFCQVLTKDKMVTY